MGVGEARPEGPIAGDGVLGEGTASPPHQLGGLRERCKLRQGVGRSPGRRRVFLYMCRQIALPSISVRVAYSLHGYRHRLVWPIPIADERVDVQVKL